MNGHVPRDMRNFSHDQKMALKKIYGQVSQYAPLAREWAQNLALPGTKKGCLATEYNFEKRASTFREDNNSLQPPSHNDYEYELHAKKDVNKVMRAMKHIKLRKSVPDWSVPVEIFAMLILPERRKTAPERLGIGYLGAPPIAIRFHTVLTALFFCVRKSERVPVIWNLAVGYQLLKNNGCTGTAAIRLIFGLCTLGKLFFTPMFKENRSWKQYPHFAHGCRANHSREEAIFICIIAGDKLLLLIQI